MRLNLQGKKQVVSKINNIIGKSLSAIVASLDRMTVNEITDLRSMCRKNNVYICVVPNTLICRIFKDSIFKCLQHVFVGSNIIAFSTLESSDCIKLFVKFSKEHTKFKIKGAVFDGVFIEESKIALLATLPSYKDSITNLMFVMREATIGRLVRLLRVLCSDKKF